MRNAPGSAAVDPREPLPERALLSPVWTVHTLRQVLATGPLAGPAPAL